MKRHTMYGLSLVMLAAMVLPARAARNSLPAADKALINQMLDKIAQRKDLKFVRLDKIYSASTAVSYLRFKWDMNKSRVHSVQDFINLQATGGAHGEVTYYVQYPDGHRRPAKDVMEEVVRELQSQR